MRSRMRWGLWAGAAAALVAAGVAFGEGVGPLRRRGSAPFSGADEVRRQALSVQARLIEVIERVKPSVVAVFSQAPGGRGRGGGSGVLIDADGYALTNYHVVAQSLEVRCGLPDGRIYPAKVIGRDPTGDIALLRLRGKKAFPYATLGDSDDLAPGEWGLAMGNPFNLATDFQPTVTLGIISGLNRYIRGRGDNTLIYTNSIQIDTPINPGNSGGPLFNSGGELIGINGRISGRPARGKVNVGTGFAISINQIKRFLPMLRAGRDVYHARLGVQVAARETGGVTVATVLPESAAEEADIRADDVILRFNGRPVLSRQHLVNMIGVLPAGTDATLAILRDGKERAIEVTLEGLPAGRGVAAGRGRGKAVVPASKPSNPEKAPDAEAILAAHVTAIGGRDAIDAIEGTRLDAEATIYGRLRVKAQVIIYAKRPNKVRTNLTATIKRRVRGRERTQKIDETRAFDGRQGWLKRTRGGAVAMPGNEVEDLRRETLESQIIRDGLPPKDVTLAVLGEATIGDRRVVVIHAKGPNLGRRWWSFDVQTHRLVRTRYRSLTTGLWLVEDLSDYRPVNGVQMPFRIEDYRGGRMSADVIVTSIKVDNALKDSLFAAP